MFKIVLLCLVAAAYAQISLPHGHSLFTIIDGAFGRNDANHDGIVTESEFDALVQKDDLDGNGCISQAEFLAARQGHAPSEVTGPMFQHLATASGSGPADCISVQDMSAEFHLIDHNNDNQATMKEYEHYFSHLLNTLTHQG